MPTWETATDWDNAQSESGVVHESVTNTDHNDATIVKQGYPYASPLFSANLIAYWPMHEDSGSTMNDVSGNNHDGSITGATVGAGGLLGNTAYSFDGTDDWVSVPDSAALDIDGTTDMTVTYWIKASSYTGGAVVIGKGDSSGGVNNVWDNIVANDGLRATWQDGGSAAYAYIPKSSVFDGVWHMISMVTDKTNGTGYFYLDASLSESTDISGVGDQSNGDDVEFMSRQENGDYQSGTMAEPQIIGSALSQSELQTLYDVVQSSGALTTAAKSW